MQILVEQIFKNASVNNTLDEIITRFGDGEFNLIYEKGIYFQEYNQKLCKKLRKILKSNEDGLLIGIKIPYKRKQLDRYINVVKCFYINFINNNKFQIYKLLNKNMQYYSSDITRFYIDFKNKIGVPNYIKKL